NDALAGFVKVWLYKPSGFNPIGAMNRTAMIGGRMWNVWVGAVGAKPVVTYVAAATITSVTLDLKPFLSDAAASGVPSSWYVTDVFGGFEIWTGADSLGLELLELTANVQ